MSKLTKIDYESIKTAYDKGYESGDTSENPYSVDTPNFDEFNKAALLSSLEDYESIDYFSES